MLTFSDIKKLAQQDDVLSVLYDWAFKDDPFWDQPAIRTIAGNGVKYNIKTSRAAISWQDPTEDIVESSPTFTQRSASIYTGIMDVYLFAYAKAINKIQDSDAVTAKSQWEDFLSGIKQMMVVGGTTTSSTPKQPKGIMKLLAEIESETTTDLDSVNNSQVVANSATSGALTETSLQKLIDKTVKPNFMMMSKRSRRKIIALLNASGSHMEFTPEQAGFRLGMYGGLPIYINDFVPDNIQDGSSSVIDISAYVQSTAEPTAGNDNSIIFCGRVKDDSGFCINQVEPWKAEPVGISEKKDAHILRISTHMGFAAYDKYCIAGLINVSDE